MYGGSTVIVYKVFFNMQEMGRNCDATDLCVQQVALAPEWAW